MYRFSVIGSLLIFLICFSASIATASYSRPYHFSDIKVSMTQQALKTYGKLLREARAHPAKMITEEIKSRRLPGTISWKQLDLNNKLVSRTAIIEMRFTGDWTDHLGTAKKGDFSSLKIKLINGNLAGMVKFRLLRYKTRYLDEVTASLLMEMLGYPVPYRGAMAVKINGNNQFMIFEEAPVKEFIERFGFREAPIVEGDERQLWQNRSLNNQSLCLGKMTEENKCNAGGDPNVIFGKIDNKSFLKNDVALEIGNDAIISHKNLLAELLNLTENSPTEVQVYSKLVMKFAWHSLVPHNFKSIYDPMYKRSLPIFFDGNVKLNKLGADLKKGCKARLSSKYKSLKAQKFIQVYNKEYLSRTGQPIYENQECAVIEAFRKVERLLGPDFTPRSEFYKKKWSANYNPESKGNNVIDPLSKKFDFKKAALGHQKDGNSLTLLGEGYKNKGLVQTFFINRDASQGIRPAKCYYLIPNKQFVDCGEATFKEIRGSMAGRKKSKPFEGYKLYSIFLPNNLKTKGKTVVIGSETLTDSKKVLHVPKNTTFVVNKNLIGKHLKYFYPTLKVPGFYSWDQQLRTPP